MTPAERFELYLPSFGSVLLNRYLRLWASRCDFHEVCGSSVANSRSRYPRAQTKVLVAFAGVPQDRSPFCQSMPLEYMIQMKEEPKYLTSWSHPTPRLYRHYSRLPS